MKHGARARQAGRFDAFDLAARATRLAGEVDLGRRPRIADRLAPTAAGVPLAWSIVGGRDAAGRPTVTVALEGRLPLLCQRCLQAFDLRLAQQTELLLARSEAELAALDEGGETEVLLAAAPLDALTLIEDEILLSLPYAPRHADGPCAEGSGAEASAQVKPAPRPTSPFARLAALKKGTARSFEE